MTCAGAPPINGSSFNLPIPKKKKKKEERKKEGKGKKQFFPYKLVVVWLKELVRMHRTSFVYRVQQLRAEIVGVVRVSCHGNVPREHDHNAAVIQDPVAVWLAIAGIAYTLHWWRLQRTRLHG